MELQVTEAAQRLICWSVYIWLNMNNWTEMHGMTVEGSVKNFHPKKNFVN